MDTPDVLVVGAGPTGLVLALSLARQGVMPRIVEKNSGPGESSRAMAVHARTLEFYRQLGFGDEVVSRGIRIERIHLREGSHEVALFELSDIGEGLSPYPFVLSFPQDEHEQLLIEKLRAVGVEVEWDTEVVGFDQADDRVRATLRRGGVEETVDAAYLCGCDGARSTVRRGLGLGYPGGTYEQVFFVADVKATGEAVDNDDMNGCLGKGAFCIVFPIRTSGMHRFIGIVPKELQSKEDLTFEDVRPALEAMIDVRVEHVNWFSRYQSHHRVAEHFRVGRAFIAGDAGHIHSPAGGQGMNTGIGDAVNLAWKLAGVIGGRIAPACLDTYEPERIAFARTLVESTDRAFKLIAGQGITGQMVRELFMPHIAPFAMGFSSLRRAAFRLVSQTRINYRDSALSDGAEGHIHGGDRLPWVEGADNFAPLRALDWQIHVHGAASDAVRDVSRTIPIHEFPWSEAADEAGYARDAVYLVRPDGYVGVATRDAATLRDYLERFEIATRE